MGRRGPLRTGLRDRLEREKASTSKRPKKSPSKRLKVSNSSTNSLPTPFVSTTTGEVYSYNFGNEEANTFLKCTPTDSHTEVPASASAFLLNAASHFSTAVNDVIVSPELLVVNFTMNPEKLPVYYKFCKPGKHRIPNSDCFLQVEPSHMEDILTEHYGFNFDLFGQEESDFMETSSSSSEYSDQEIDPKPTSTATIPVAVPASTAAAELPRAENSQKSALPKNDAPAPTPNRPTIAQPGPEIPVPSPPNATSIEAPLTTKQATQQQQQQALRRRTRARFTEVDFNKLQVSVPKENFLTILFRPTSTDDSLHKANPYKITAALRKLGGHPIRTRNIRDGGLAADFDPATPSEPLLQINQLLDTPVTASLPKTSDSCTGVVCGVHWEIADDQIAADLRTEPPLPILAVKRLAKPGQQSWTVKITFKGTILPTRAFLEGRSHRVRAYVNKPLQCFQCGRYSHTARVCRSKANCWTCSGDHDTKECPNQASPKCGNCGGQHTVDSKSCPIRNMELKIVQVKASENVPYKTARIAVSRAAKSYASAVKENRPAKQQQPPVATPNFIPNVAHPRPPQQPDINISVIFQGLIAILTAAATTKDFAGALLEVLKLFQSNCPNPELFQLPG